MPSGLDITNTRCTIFITQCVGNTGITFCNYAGGTAEVVQPTPTPTPTAPSCGYNGGTVEIAGPLLYCDYVGGAVEVMVPIITEDDLYIMTEENKYVIQE